VADGSLIFLGFLIVFFFAFVWGFYTRTGSGINQHSYARRYSSAPGASHPSQFSGRDVTDSVATWTRGTR
jgi:hypothetical protein